ncbi:M1 family aminopeptidase [Spirosoma gilvum]
MKNLYFLLLFPLLTYAQIDDGGQFCRINKVRYFGQLASNPKARMAYPGDASIDITYYGLDLRFTTSPASMTAATIVTLKSTVPGLPSFFLDLNSTTTSTTGLKVDSVKAGSQKLTFLHAQNKLTITPTQPLANGQALTLAIYYHGVPDSGVNGSFAFGKHESTNDPVIWSLSEPYGASDWFPCRDTPADKADSSSVRITAPAQMVSVSNGKLISTTTNNDGTKTYLWKNSYPIAQYLISIAVSNYAQYDTPYSNRNQTMTVTHYIYPENLAQVQSNLALTPGMIQLFTNRFGEYPFLREKYGHAQFAYGNGGMEHQTITSMELRALTPTTIAHELAHQWFGDKITCRDWQNIWLNEGFASYGEAVYTESASGQSGYQSYINNFMTSARLAQGSIYVQDISNFNNIFNSNRTYAKGATVLHMLRGVVGDSTFYRILRTYVASPLVAYKNAVTEDFQAIAQQVSEKNLNYFFSQWIYGAGYPAYKATITTGGTTATVQLTQTNALATSPGSFTMPIQMKVQSAAGDTTVTVYNDQADQTFTLPARGKVTNVVIDPNNWILKTLTSTIVTATVVTGITEPNGIGLRIYPNPTAENLTVDFTQPASGPATLSLTNLLGQRVRAMQEANLSPGNYSRNFSLRGLASGRYTVTVETPSGLQSRVVLVR